MISLVHHSSHQVALPSGQAAAPQVVLEEAEELQVHNNQVVLNQADSLEDQADQADQADKMNSLDQVDQADKMDSLGQADKMDSLDQVDQADKMDSLGQAVKMDQVDHLDQEDQVMEVLVLALQLLLHHNRLQDPEKVEMAEIVAIHPH